MTISEIMKRFINNEMPTQTVVGKVISIDETNMTCDIELPNKPNMLDVRIRSLIDDQNTGILIVPKLSSVVLVGLIENREESAFICTYSEIDKIHLIVNDIQLSGDAFGGLVKVDELTQKLNKVENAVNQLKADFNSHTHNAPQAPTGTVPTLPPLIPSTVTLINTVRNDIENQKVKHG